MRSHQLARLLLSKPDGVMFTLHQDELTQAEGVERWTVLSDGGPGAPLDIAGERQPPEGVEIGYSLTRASQYSRQPEGVLLMDCRHNCIVVTRRRFRDAFRLTFWCICIECNEFVSGPCDDSKSAWKTVESIDHFYAEKQET